MLIFYFDNFRGFQSTFLDLKNVNFFVGENSTGKTSVLKLFGIIASQGFWRYSEFGNDETNLGGFADIITSPRTGKDYIEIGFCGQEPTAEENPFSMKLRFIERDNFPLLKEICYKAGVLNMQAIIEGEVIKYRYAINETNQKNGLDTYKSWITDNGLNKIPFSRIALDTMGILPVLAQIIKVIISEKNLPYNIIEDAYRATLPSFINQAVWIAPIRAEPQVSYRHEGLVYNSQGKHTFSVLKEIITGSDVKKILKRFGSDSGLYDDISIIDLLNKSKDSRLFQVLLNINGQERNIVNVGYGVSQILPIIVESIARQDNLWFAIQQPEVHLHPKAQAALGDFIFKTNVLDHQNFLLETHSDYIIDRFRLRINRALREGNKKTRFAQVVFFSKTKGGNKLDIIGLNEDGSYSEEQPKEFRDFFIREQLEIISI